MKNESGEALRPNEMPDEDDPIYRIVRDDLQEDSITQLRFTCYDDAYDELESFYGDLCCSDDRVEYSIVMT